MTDDYTALLSRLLDGTLSPGEFSHHAHIAVAWTALSKMEFFEACQTIASGLRQLTETAGVPEKYNATVTLAFMSLIAERMAGTKAGTADGFIKAHPELLDPGLITGLYSDVRISGDVARAVALLPDRALAV